MKLIPTDHRGYCLQYSRPHPVAAIKYEVKFQLLYCRTHCE